MDRNSSVFEELSRAMFPMKEMFGILNNKKEEPSIVDDFFGKIKDIEKENKLLKQSLGEIKVTLIINFGEQARSGHKILDGSERNEYEMMIKCLSYYNEKLTKNK
jgi:hypothetical protein